MALKGNYLCHVTSFRLKCSPTAQSMSRRGQLYTFITYVSQSNTNTHIDRIYLSVTSSHITCVPLPNKETNALTFMGNITHPEETPGCGSESKWHYKSAGSPPPPPPSSCSPGNLRSHLFSWWLLATTPLIVLHLPSSSVSIPPPCPYCPSSSPITLLHIAFYPLPPPNSLHPCLSSCLHFPD